MGRIYAKAQQEKMNRNLNEIFAMLDNLKDENWQISKQKILARLKEMMAESENHQSEIIGTGSGWNFSREKTQSIFAEDDTIQLCPFFKGDDKFYFLIREQYKIFEKKFSEEQLIASYWAETQKDSADTEEEAKIFEEENLELITEHMRMLAKELDVAPKKLLSHVLDYRLDL